MPADKTIGLLLMAYGSPEDLADIGAYLLDIRDGRATSAKLVNEISGRYQAIGGRSPLLEITRQQAHSLEQELNSRCSDEHIRFKAYVGMRHWDPRIKSAVEQMKADGIHDLIALVMAPHSSTMSTGAYFSKLDQAIQETGAPIRTVRVQDWHTQPEFLQAILEKVLAALIQFRPATPYIIFSAHSLPARILAQGDPYERQLKETASLLADNLGLKPGRWQFSYQSAGRSDEPWLGPPIEQVISQLVRSGEKNLLVVPIGFVSDHIEVLYDIDIVCRRLAEQAGARLERTESLNDSPAFIHALAAFCLNAYARIPFEIQ